VSHRASGSVFGASRSDAVLYPDEEVVFYGREYNPRSWSQGIALRNSGETVCISCGGVTIDQWAYPGGSSDGVVLRRY